MGECEKINAQEAFCWPNYLNYTRCSFIRYGKLELSDVLTREGKDYYAKSVFLQLHKPERKFAYHIEFLPAYKRYFKRITNNSRPYIIHINLEHGCDNSDILESYYFARVLDRNMSRDDAEHINVESAIRATEWHFENEFDVKDLAKQILKKGWSLDYIYLDAKKNRYSVQFE